MSVFDDKGNLLDFEQTVSSIHCLHNIYCGVSWSKDYQVNIALKQKAHFLYGKEKEQMIIPIKKVLSVLNGN